MPSSKITNQYARRARIVPIPTYAPNHNSSVTDIMSEEVYSLIHTNTSDTTATETNANGSKPSDPSRFLKMLLLLLGCIIVIGSVVHIISLKKGMEDSKDEQQQQHARRHSIILEKDENMEGESNATKSTSHANILSEVNMAYGEKVELSSSVDNLANVMDPIRTTDVPTFWHIPRAGGSTVKDITTVCLMLTQASQVGVAISKDDTELKVVEDIEGGKFMNVDTTTPHGISRAVKFRLSSSPDLDLVVTPYVFLATELFDEGHRGRMFTMMRHPIHRAVSLYHAMKNNKHTKSMLEDVSLESYAKGSMVENNWMTRFLANQQNGELHKLHEALAKEILRTKFLIGLLKYKDTSMARFESYFGWKNPSEKGQDCQERLLDWNWSNKNIHPVIDSKSNAFKSLEKQNEYDLRLYAYAEKLFRDQGILFQKDDDHHKKENMEHVPEEVGHG